MTHKPKRFRLSFIGPIEDQPRLIRAYGRACEGEFALVMRPSEGRAVLVLITKGDGAFLWRSGQEPDDGLVQAKATVLRDGETKLRIESGEHAGVSFRPYGKLPAGLGHGDLVDVAFSPDDQFAHLRGAGSGGDAPRRPEAQISAADAVKLVKIEQKAVPSKPGPTTLRGRWTGTLICDDGKPIVELSRKLASYGTLSVTSRLDEGWSWSFERSEKWFADEGATTGEGLPTLAAAIEAGVLGAMSLVREACSFRDTRRRAAHDTEYAVKHPIKPPKPMRDPTERLQAPKRGRKARSAAPPKPVEDGTPKPEVPETAAALGRMAEVAAREGDALAELTGRRWIWEETTPARDIAGWFADSGFDGIADSIRDYAGHPETGMEEFLEELASDLRTAHLVHDDSPDPKVYERAEAQLVLLRKSLRTAPAMMERARRLIRYAGAMARSPMCRGRDQKEAVEAVKRASQAYEEARAAILEGQSWDALKTLRRIGERVALSAAKAARSCSSGQTSLTAIAEGTTPKRRGKPKRTPKALPPTPAELPDAWEPFAEGDRAVFEELRGTVTRVPAGAYGPADPVTFLADGRKRGRRVEARLLVRESTAATAAEGAVDAGKDKALIDAFGAAISAALGGQAA